MPYEVRRRGKTGWGCWNKGSTRWMAKKPQSYQDAAAQCSAVRGSEEGDWEPTGKPGRRYKAPGKWGRRKAGKGA